MSFRRRASKEAVEQCAADRELAATYAQLRSGAALAERELRQAQAGDRPLAEIRERLEALDHAVGAALKAALAGERAASGPNAYEDRIAARRARVRDDVRRWTGEVSMLRTVRETFRLEGMSRTGTLLPTHVQVGAYAMSSPPVPGAEPGQPDDVGEQLDEPRIGVDLDEAVGGRPAYGAAPDADAQPHLDKRQPRTDNAT